MLVHKLLGANSVGIGARSWAAIACSSDGSRVVVAAWGDYVYTSADGGNTWEKRTSAGVRNWRSIACSSDGFKIVAAAYGQNLFTSNDGGETWVERTASGVKNWLSVDSSSDGNKIVASGGVGSYVYTSSDAGLTWNQTSIANPAIVSCSSDGLKIVGSYSAITDQIFFSSDGGTSWLTKSVSATPANYTQSAKISGDGTKIVANVKSSGTGTGYLYRSTNGGDNWTRQDNAGERRWGNAIDCSNDGVKIISAPSSGYVYISSNSGISWLELTSIGSRSWQSFCMSDDGSKIFAAPYNGSIFRSVNGGTSWSALP